MPKFTLEEYIEKFLKPCIPHIFIGPSSGKECTSIPEKFMGYNFDGMPTFYGVNNLEYGHWILCESYHNGIEVIDWFEYSDAQKQIIKLLKLPNKI